MFDVGDLPVLNFGNYVLKAEWLSGLWNYTYVFYVFLRFFSKSKKHDFLRFFELLHTFSRTLRETINELWVHSTFWYNTGLWRTNRRIDTNPQRISRMSNEEVRRRTVQPPLTHITRTTRLKFFNHIARADPSMDHSESFGPVWPLCEGTVTADQADHATPLNRIWHHSTLGWLLHHRPQNRQGTATCMMTMCLWWCVLMSTIPVLHNQSVTVMCIRVCVCVCVGLESTGVTWLSDASGAAGETQDWRVKASVVSSAVWWLRDTSRPRLGVSKGQVQHTVLDSEPSRRLGPTWNCLLHVYYFAPGRVRSIAISMSVSLSVCPLAYLKNHTAELHQSFYAYCLWPWFGPPLTALRCDMYFRFCGCRYVFSSRNNPTAGASCVFLSSESVTAKTTASTPTEFCSTIKISSTDRGLRTGDGWGEVCHLRLLFSIVLRLHCRKQSVVEYDSC